MTKKKDEPRHCDDYFYDFRKPLCFRAWLLVNRLSAADRSTLYQVGCDPKLFATYKGKRVRVTMASRLGDIGVSYDLNRDMGYDERGIRVDDLTDFGDRP